jgi:hypothetical protein
MSSLVLKAYFKLVQFDANVRRGDFAALHKKVREFPLEKQPVPADTIEKVCSAVNVACIWYWRQVLCLQRSAVTACLLKLHGVPAVMAIGVQPIPFKAHAWVEVEGRVVNDKPYMLEMYSVLDRC